MRLSSETNLTLWSVSGPPHETHLKTGHLEVFFFLANM